MVFARALLQRHLEAPLPGGRGHEGSGAGGELGDLAIGPLEEAQLHLKEAIKQSEDTCSTHSDSARTQYPVHI